MRPVSRRPDCARRCPDWSLPRCWTRCRATTCESGGAFRRRRIVVALVLVLGSVLLGISLSVRPGDRAFYPLTGALAAVWVLGGAGVRAAAPGSDRLPRHAPPADAHPDPGRPGGGRGVRRRRAGGPRDRAAARLHRERAGARPAAVRCRCWRCSPCSTGSPRRSSSGARCTPRSALRYPVLISTVVYAVVTVATGNPMLVFAAADPGPGARPAAARLGRGAGADPDPRHLVGGDAVRAAAAVRLTRATFSGLDRRGCSIVGLAVVRERRAASANWSASSTLRRSQLPGPPGQLGGVLDRIGQCHRRGQVRRRPPPARGWPAAPRCPRPASGRSCRPARWLP